MTSIGSYAFEGCTSLKSITIPSRVTNMGVCVFASCNLLARITFDDPSTWFKVDGYIDFTNKTGGVEFSVIDSSSNAVYFVYQYKNYYWYKI